MFDIKTFFAAVKPHLNEKTRRLVAAALTLGTEEVGVKGRVSRDTGVSHHAINRGLLELQDGALKETGHSGIRSPGGGRKKYLTKTRA